MFNLNSVIRRQSCPRSPTSGVIMITCVTRFSETSFPLEMIDTHFSNHDPVAAVQLSSIFCFCNDKDYKVGFCVRGACTPSSKFW